MARVSSLFDLRFIVILVVPLALLGAVLFGSFIGDENYMPIVFTATAAVGVALVLGIGKNYWILIPILFTATGSSRLIPIPFSVAEVGVLAAFALYFAYLSAKRATLGFKVNWADALMFVNLAYLVFTYFRNPTGLAFFGSDQVGGRHYITIAIALIGYWVLAHSKTTPRLIFWMPLLIVLPNLLLSSLNVVTQVFPALGAAIYPIYSGVDISGVVDVNRTVSSEEERFFALGKLGIMIVQTLCAYFSPVLAFMPGNFWIGILLGIAFIAILFSGFRSGIAGAGAYVYLSLFFRRQWGGIVAITAVAIVILAFIGLGNALDLRLPFSWQRALSFIPLGWESKAVEQAEGSTDWRVEMWEDALFTDRVIKNKAFGDGFGFRADELKIMVADLMYGDTGLDGREGFIVRGSFHSGPVSSIRFVGYAGLGLLFVFQILFIRESVKLFKETRSTPYFPLAMFIALWVVYTVFEFYFIFGAYNNYVTDALFYLGLIHLLRNSMRANQQAQVPVPLGQLPLETQLPGMHNLLRR